MKENFFNNICDELNRENLNRWYGDDYSSDFLQELRDAAWNIVKENPGIERQDWIDTLIRQYPTEVVDAYGTDPWEVNHSLSDLWEMEYTDPDTGGCNSFAGWSEYFATDPYALRAQLERANERIRELETELSTLKSSPKAQ